MDDNTELETTIGQLNFLKWAFSNLIIDYINVHKKEIENDMNNCLKQLKKKSKNEGEKNAKKFLNLQQGV